LWLALHYLDLVVPTAFERQTQQPGIGMFSSQFLYLRFREFWFL